MPGHSFSLHNCTCFTYKHSYQLTKFCVYVQPLWLLLLDVVVVVIVVVVVVIVVVVVVIVVVVVVIVVVVVVVVVVVAWLMTSGTCGVSCVGFITKQDLDLCILIRYGVLVSLLISYGVLVSP